MESESRRAARRSRTKTKMERSMSRRMHPKDDRIKKKIGSSAEGWTRWVMAAAAAVAPPTHRAARHGNMSAFTAASSWHRSAGPGPGG